MHTLVFNCRCKPVALFKALLIVIGLLPGAGCAFKNATADSPSQPNGVDRDVHAGGVPAAGSETAGGWGADAYLATVSRFLAADRRQRNMLYERASVAAALNSSAHYRLELALFKLLPGHDGFDPQAAETLLASIVDDQEQLPAGVVELAGVYLRLVKEQNRLRALNARLARELEEANSKLDQLTRIEQSVDPPVDEPLSESPQGGQTDEQ